MSAECSTCGADIVYPPGTWPIGECQVCAERALADELAEALRAIDSRFEAYTANDLRDTFGRCCADMQELALAALARYDEARRK